MLYYSYKDVNMTQLGSSPLNLINFFAISLRSGLCQEHIKDPGEYGLFASKYMLLPLNFCNIMIIQAFF